MPNFMGLFIRQNWQNWQNFPSSFSPPPCPPNNPTPSTSFWFSVGCKMAGRRVRRKLNDRQTAQNLGRTNSPLLSSAQQTDPTSVTSVTSELESHFQFIHC